MKKVGNEMVNGQTAATAKAAGRPCLYGHTTGYITEITFYVHICKFHWFFIITIYQSIST